MPQNLKKAGSRPATKTEEIGKRLKTWVSSQDGIEKLNAARDTAKATAEYVDSEAQIDPDMLHKSVTL